MLFKKDLGEVLRLLFERENPLEYLCEKAAMRSFFAVYKRLALLLLVLSAIIIYVFYQILDPKPSLPVFQPADFNPELVDNSIRHVKKYHTIADFSLVNQNGDTITQETYRDKIYVADFFFTTCPTICPVMTEHMKQIQDQIMDDEEILLLSHSVTPEIDSVAQLKKYALEKGVADHKWNLVTGDKRQIYELARKSYLAVKSDGDGGPYDMIHTENFILVDKEGRIRGTYDGTNPEAVKDLLEDIEILKSTYP